ncbi:protein FAM184A-like isoform X2 [Dysidea avara]|uniref:protein FAM184A-like isoform X2 n=1 Tax=Dysidea avara TaxID=196820 RepID=UPI003328CBB9
MAATRTKLAASSASFANLEKDYIPQEYHSRILKKLAQLTKVIYSLNTKNDQHDEFIEQLRQVHIKEIEGMKVENSNRLKQLEESHKREVELAQNRISVLQTELATLELEKSSLESKLHTGEDRVQALISEHSVKVKNIASQLESAESEARKQHTELENLKQTLNAQLSKEKTMKQQHDEDMKQLRKEKLELQNKLEQSDVKHEEEIMAMATEQAQLQQDLLNMKQEYISEREETIHHQQEKWREQEKRLKSEHHEMEETLKSQISSLSAELRVAKDNLALSEGKIRELQLTLDKTKERLSMTESKMVDMSSEKGGLNDVVGKLQLELDIANSQYDQQMKELKTLSGNLGKLEALRVANQGTIKELKIEVASLKEKVRWLETEREEIKNSSVSAHEQQARSIQSLEKELEKLSKEKQQLHSQYALEIEAAYAQCSQQETALINEHKKVLQSSEELHQQKLKEAKEETKKQLELLRKEMESMSETKVSDISSTHKTQLSQMEDRLEKTQSELHSAECEVKRLQKLMEENKKGLGSASSHIKLLQNDLKSAEQTVVQLKQELEKSTTKYQEIQFVTVQQQHSCCSKRAQEMVEAAKVTLTAELDKTWSERLKNMSSSLRAELEKRHKETSDSALAELSALKDNVLKDESEKWKHQKSQLLSQVSILERQLKEATESSKVSLSEKEHSFLTEKQLLIKELEVEKRNSEKAREVLVYTHAKQLANQESEHNKQLKSLEATLNAAHHDELKSLKLATKLATDSLKTELLKQTQNDLQSLKEKHQNELAHRIKEANENHASALDTLKIDHSKEIVGYQKSVQDLTGQKDKEVKDCMSKISMLEGKVQDQAAEIKQSNITTSELKRAVKDLNKEMELKVQQILTIRRESTAQLQHREQELLKAHKVELKSSSSYYEHKIQLLLADFNKAKDILNTELTISKERLEDMKRRYQNRESRPEDLEQIRYWKNIGSEQEAELSQLMSEKRFYQLELVNREQNYNKVFNANPTIGVLDPLQTKKKHTKVVDISGMATSSAPSLVTPVHPSPPVRPLESPYANHRSGIRKKEKAVASRQVLL